MDSAKARAVLRLYRPGTTDALDPEMALALQQVQNDPELARWFDEHCGVYIALRSKLKQIEVPADLKRRIIVDNLARKRITPFPSPAVWLAAAAVLVLVAVGSWRFFRAASHSYSFPEFAQRVVSEAQRNYLMKMISTNQVAIREYLRVKRCPADYALPKGLDKLPALGCGDDEWRGRKYSLVCFDAGKTPSGRLNDLWLFVAKRSDFAAAALPGANPQFTKIRERNTESWMDADNVYILAGLGEQPELQQYLQNN